MRKLLTILCLLLGTVGLAAEGDFTRTMTAEERALAGLEKLSPEELTQLKAVVERYKASAVEVVHQQAETKVAAAEAKATEAAAAAPAGQKKPGWLHDLISSEKSNTQASKTGDVESRLVGNFSGWRGKTVFKLENGQVWQQLNPEVFQTQSMASPQVKIYPGVFGGFWLEVEGVTQRVKVKPVKLE